MKVQHIVCVMGLAHYRVAQALHRRRGLLRREPIAHEPANCRDICCRVVTERWFLHQEVRPLDGLGLAVGRRFRLRQPRLRPAVWTVTQLHSPQSFTWTTGWPGLQLQADHALRSVEGGAELCLRMQFSGWLAPLLRPLLAGLTLDYMRREAEALARCCAGATARPKH